MACFAAAWRRHKELEVQAYPESVWFHNYIHIVPCVLLKRSLLRFGESFLLPLSYLGGEDKLYYYN